MGKKDRKQRDAKSVRARLDELLAKGDTRGAVEAAKLLVREEPGPASESLAVGAYAERIKSLIAEGLGREAAATAAIVRERYPAHLDEHRTLLENARLAAGDLDWMLSELRGATDERRASIEERLLSWISDPSAIARSASLDSDDPLARESRAVAEVFEIVTTRLASPEEMAPLGDIRRRSPLAPWKLLLRAIDAFHRKDDERVASNVAAIDRSSPAAVAGQILTELTTGSRKDSRSLPAERLIDKISGGTATIALQIQKIEAAARHDDKRTLREELRSFTKAFDKLSPYALDQVRIAMLPLCGAFFTPDQIATMFRLDERGDGMERYAVLLMESAGAPFAAALWMAHAQTFLEDGEYEPWQAAEIYLHALAMREQDDDEICTDPSHGHPIMEGLDVAAAIEKIVALNPAPSVLARLGNHLDHLNSKELRRVLAAWRKSDPNAHEPLVRLLQLAVDEGRYDEALGLIRQGDGLKILDPAFAKLRRRTLFRKAEQLLAARKRGEAEAMLAQIANRPEDLGEDLGTYLLALQWAAAPPAMASQLLGRLAERGVVGEIVVAEITGSLGMPFVLPVIQHSPNELLEGVRRSSELFQSIDRGQLHSLWLVEQTEAHLDLANEAQLFAIGNVAFEGLSIALAWKVAARGLEVGGPMLHRFLLLRAELLVQMHASTKRTARVVEAVRLLAERALDSESLNRALDLAHLYWYAGGRDRLSQEEIAAIVQEERMATMPAPPVKKTRKKAAPKQKAPKMKSEKGLFEP